MVLICLSHFSFQAAWFSTIWVAPGDSPSTLFTFIFMLMLGVALDSLAVLMFILWGHSMTGHSALKAWISQYAMQVLYPVTHHIPAILDQAGQEKAPRAS